MCGICGIASLHSVDQKKIEDMCTSLTHRGPDDQGVCIHKNIALGHRRLSIIDLESGKQPITNEDETIYLTYNGEIFNYLPLRKELEQQGHQFKTNTDSEVIVHLYEQYGAQCLEYLNGQFAFAIWDSNTQTMFLARDRLGIKPLYYSHRDNDLLFSSELKALTSQLESKTVSPQAVNLFFHYLYIPSPHTIYNEVKKLPPAHYLVWQNNKIEIKRYWKIPQLGTNVKISFEEAKQIFEEKLQNAIQKRLLSDVPLGAFLSGGIDSSTIAYWTQYKSKVPITTFSIHFPGSSNDESQFAKLVAKHLGTNHQTLELSPEYKQDEIYQAIAQFDEPFGDTSLIPTHFLCKMARQEVTVCLSGDGGDEILGGYRRYRRLAQLPDYPNFFHKLLNPIFQLLPQTKQAKKLEMISLSHAKRYINTMNNLYPRSPEVITPNFFQAAKAENYLSKYLGMSNQSSRENMLYTDMHTFLPEFVLTKVDRMSMMNSLEVRVPFLDHELVEYACQLPLHYKFSAKDSKILLKKSMHNKIPSEILNRPKKGFGIPLGYWFKSGFQNFAREILEQPGSNEIFSRSKVRELLKSDKTVKQNKNLLWSLIVFEIWYKNNMQ